MKRVAFPLLLAVLALAQAPEVRAQAQAASSPDPAGKATNAATYANLGVTAVVGAQCLINMVSDVNFGVYVPASNTDATGAVQVTCGFGTSAVITLNDGLHSLAQRRMSNGLGNYLQYELYKDAARAMRWGSLPGEDVSYVGLGTPQLFNIYGRIPAGQVTSPAGSYSDVVTITVQF